MMNAASTVKGITFFSGRKQFDSSYGRWGRKSMKQNDNVKYLGCYLKSTAADSAAKTGAKKIGIAN